MKGKVKKVKMELKEDITERKKQADRIVRNPKTSPEELTKWYDLWSKTYEQVGRHTVSAHS